MARCGVLAGLTMVFASLSWTATPVWIDTDPSVERGGHEVDDGLALMQAFHSPELAIRGVSVVFGNSPLETAFPIGQRLARDFGPPGLPVFKGAASAGQLGVETPASRSLADALTREKLTILAIGPLTNIGTLLRRRPELASRIERIVAVAGRRPGQHFITGTATTAFRDFNFELDPDAFRIVLDSHVPLVLAPWEISSKVWISTADLARIKPGWVAEAAADWLQRWKKSFGVDGFNPFDTLAVGYIISPSSFGCETLPVEIQTLPEDTKPSSSKPYLIAAKSVQSKSSALYCFEPPAGFHDDLVGRLSAIPKLEHSAWNQILRQYVNAESRVNYRALKEQDGAKLDRYLDGLAGAWPKNLSGDERKAALINAYNAFTVRWILANYPVESIWRTKHPFTEARHTIDNTKVSLDRIEARLRDMGDSRIHAALVCAARSCPPLRREAYEASRVDSQLDSNAREWLANGALNEFFPDRRSAEVSMIFKWYRGDFEKGGPAHPQHSVPEFLAQFGPAGKTQFLREPGSDIQYRTYRWGLNDATEIGSKYSALQFSIDAARNKVF